MDALFVLITLNPSQEAEADVLEVAVVEVSEVEALGVALEEDLVVVTKLLQSLFSLEGSLLTRMKDPSKMARFFLISLL
jgi:hypothetical protein